MQLGQERDQVLQGPAKSVNRPSHDDVELAPGRTLAQSVESGPPISTLGAADALVAIDLDDLAAHPVGDLPERALLVSRSFAHSASAATALRFSRPEMLCGRG